MSFVQKEIWKKMRESLQSRGDRECRMKEFACGRER